MATSPTKSEEIISQSIAIEQQFDLDAILKGTQNSRWCPWKHDCHSRELGESLIQIWHVGGCLAYRADTKLDDLL